MATGHDEEASDEFIAGLERRRAEGRHEHAALVHERAVDRFEALGDVELARKHRAAADMRRGTTEEERAAAAE